MQKQSRRYRSSFWRDFGDYIKGEIIAILKVVGLCLLCLYILVSLLVGMYHVARYLVLWAIFGEPPSL